MRPYLLVASLLGFGACSSTPSGTIAITLGGEPDALTRAPAPTSLVVDSVDADGGVSNLATVALPAETATLSDMSQDAAGIVRITGKDATGVTRVWGASLPVSFGALTGTTLTVFVQRTGEMARMPNALTDARESPLVTTAAGRYVFVTGGTDPAKAASTAIYDLLGWNALPSPPTLPRAPRSIAVSGTKVLTVDDAGATLFDLADSTSATVTPPSGFAFADVVGGAMVLASDASAYLVGATRADAPANHVLQMDAGANFQVASLTAPRQGAAAAWVSGRGLFVFGGSASAPAVEMLAPGTTNAIAASFPPRNIAGAAATALDGDRVLVAWASGNQGSFLTYDLARPDPNVAPVTATLPCSAKHIDLFGLDGTRALAIAEDRDSCAFTWDGTVVTPATLKVPRKGARGVRAPTGAIIVVGGSATMEQFSP